MSSLGIRPIGVSLCRAAQGQRLMRPIDTNGRNRTKGPMSFQMILRSKDSPLAPVVFENGLTAEDFKRISKAIDPEGFQRPGSKVVVRHIKERVKEGDLEALCYSRVADATSSSRVRSFILESRTTKYYVALALLFPPDLRSKLLEQVLNIRSILAECKQIEITPTRKSGNPRPPKRTKKPEKRETLELPSLDRLKALAEAINTELFKDYPGAMEVAEYIKSVLERGQLGLLSRKEVERAVESIQKVEDFARLCVGNGSWFAALASVIDDREVVETIFEACQLQKVVREKALSKCGSFKGILISPQEPTKKKPTKAEKKEKEREGLKHWANELFGDLIEDLKKGKLGPEEMKKLKYSHAVVHYQKDSNNDHFSKFCKTFGGVKDSSGWYQALQVVFGLTDRHIEQIMFG